MSGFDTLMIETSGEGFYEITDQVKRSVDLKASGLLTLFIPHTSCALTINESFDPSAKKDMEEFLKHLAPRNLSFITHTAEGPDDSPSHMKSILLQNSLQFIVEGGEIVMGQWQGVYLCEFRDGGKSRELFVKFQQD